MLNKSDEQIIRWLDVKEHSLDNSFYYGMDKMMFGTGPTSITQDRPPSASLLWWLPPYNTNTGQANNPSVLQLGSGVTNDFVGGDPAGFSAIGAGGIVSANYKGWRHRVGSYTVFNEDDAIDTIVECMDKCHFTPAQSYSQIVSETSPRWDLIAPYSRIKLARKISVSQVEGHRPDSRRALADCLAVDESGHRQRAHGRPRHGHPLAERLHVPELLLEQGQDRPGTRSAHAHRPLAVPGQLDADGLQKPSHELLRQFLGSGHGIQLVPNQPFSIHSFRS